MRILTALCALLIICGCSTTPSVKLSSNTFFMPNDGSGDKLALSQDFAASLSEAVTAAPKKFTKTKVKPKGYIIIDNTKYEYYGFLVKGDKYWPSAELYRFWNHLEADNSASEFTK